MFKNTRKLYIYEQGRLAVWYDGNIYFYTLTKYGNKEYTALVKESLHHANEEVHTWFTSHKLGIV